MNVELVEAPIGQLAVMQRMGSYYVYDISEFVGGEPGWEFPDAGAYECEDFRPYFEDPKANPFFIRVEGELAGFAIVNQRGAEPEVDFNMAQFFVLRKFKRKGVGRWAAEACFTRFPGLWDVMVLPKNAGAQAFWSRTIDRFTGGVFDERRRTVAHLRHSDMNVFRFKS
ncbi:MAG: GNAT family N-acetyltransferase [Caulobacteraceae bacterium]